MIRFGFIQDLLSSTLAQTSGRERWDLFIRSIQDQMESQKESAAILGILLMVLIVVLIDVAVARHLGRSQSSKK